MSRKNNSNPISLFAFQDIITAVTGIVLLLVILLSLCLVQLPDDAAPDSPASSADQIKTKIRDLQSKIKALNRPGSDQFNNNLLLTSDQLRDRLDKRESLIKQLQKEEAHLQESLAISQERSRELSKQISTNPVLSETKSLEKESADIEARISKLKTSNRRIYNFRDTTSPPWMIDLGKTKTVIALANTPKSKVVFADPDIDRRIANIKSWLSQNAKSSANYVVIVREGTVPTYREVHRQLEKSGTQYGVDVVGSTVSVLDQ